MKIKRLGYAAGAELSGIDLRKPLDPAMVADIRKAMLENLVVCFPNQELEDQEFTDFASRFGKLEVGGSQVYNRTPHVVVLTNKTTNGREWDGYKPGHNWHSDDSHTTLPTAFSFLLAQEVPEVGGDTIWANQYLAYEALSPAMQRLAESLSAIHASTLPLRGAMQLATSPAAGQRWTVQPMVRVHAETKRKALYVGTRVQRFAGMTEEESRPLIGFFQQHTVRYEFTYRHHWSAGDLIVWDNRCTLHIALCDYDMRSEVRHMIRCATEGEPMGEWYRPESEGGAAEPKVAAGVT